MDWFNRIYGAFKQEVTLSLKPIRLKNPLVLRRAENPPPPAFGNRDEWRLSNNTKKVPNQQDIAITPIGITYTGLIFIHSEIYETRSWLPGLTRGLMLRKLNFEL